MTRLGWTLLRLLVGGVFATAAITKSIDPVRSVEAVAAFHLLPPAAAVALGLVLPGLEAAVAASLLTRHRTRAGASAGMLLSGSFAVAVGSALVRTLDVDCGCLGEIGFLGGATPALLAVDLSLLAACTALCWREVRHEGTTDGTTDGTEGVPVGGLQISGAADC